MKNTRDDRRGSDKPVRLLGTVPGRKTEGAPQRTIPHWGPQALGLLQSEVAWQKAEAGYAAATYDAKVAQAMLRRALGQFASE